jgi:hypothetical protein
MTTTLPPLTGAGGGAGSGAGCGAGVGSSTWGGSCGAGSAGGSASSELDGAGSVVGSGVADGVGWADGDVTAEDRPGTVTGGPANADVETLALAALRCGGDSTGAEQDAITKELATAAIKATASRCVRALMVRTLPSTGRPSGTSRGVGSREECAHYCGLDPP